MSPDDRPAAGELPDLLSEFWAPLCAVESHDGSGRHNAQICVSVLGASIVPERPRLLVILSRTTFTHDLVSRSGTLAVTLLAEEQLDLLEPLGLRSGRDGEKLSGLPHAATADGDPLFTGGVGYLACEVLRSSDLGDSTAYLVAVRERERLAPRRAAPPDALGGGVPPGRGGLPRALGEEERARAGGRAGDDALALRAAEAGPHRRHSLHSPLRRGSSVGRAHD